jgi:cytochrome c-type biogenesis protein CcmE
MADVSWQNTDADLALEKPRRNRLMFVVGGVLLISAVVFLVINAMSGSTQLYKTVNEFYAEQERLVGRDLRVSGWVIGDSIQYTQIDAHNSRLEFDITDDLSNPGQTLHVVVLNEPKPDLLQHEAQALVEGHGDANGVFMSDPGGLMLKCPTRYEEMDPALHPDSVPTT